MRWDKFPNFYMIFLSVDLKLDLRLGCTSLSCIKHKKFEKLIFSLICLTAEVSCQSSIFYFLIKTPKGSEIFKRSLQISRKDSKYMFANMYFDLLRSDLVSILLQ